MTGQLGRTIGCSGWGRFLAPLLVGIGAASSTRLKTTSTTRRLIGPVTTLLAIAIIEWLAQHHLKIPNPPAILLLLVVYSCFSGGMAIGLFSAALSWLYVAWFFSIPAAPFRYEHDNFLRVAMWAVTIPLIAIMVGSLKRRSERALRKHVGTIERLIAARTKELEDTNRHLAKVISDQRSIERELQHAKDQAEATSRSKSSFLAMMSHEIRNPLGLMMGFAELTLAHETPAAEKDNYLSTIVNNGRHLSRLLDNILDLSKVESGRIELEHITFNLADVLNELIALFSPRAHERGITLQTLIEGQLPEFIVADSLRFKQILMNIIGNAIKFTDHGSITIKIRSTSAISDQKPTSNLDISIADTGPGITPEQAKRLFEPFAQADRSVARRYGGSGLGLVLSRHLARAMGGDIVLEDSSPGKGSIFRISVPVVIAEGGSPTVPQALQTSSSPTRIQIDKLSNVKILVVDDALDNLTLMHCLLKSARASPTTVDNAADGIKIALRENFEIILMDLQMPGVDGYEATKILRSRGLKGPIIALTAHTMKGERERCLASGFTDHLSKPIHRDHLLETLAKYAGSNSPHEQTMH